MCLLLPYQQKNKMKFLLRFLLNLSITLLPAEELNYFMLRFIPNNVCHLLTCAPEDDLCRISYQKGCPVSPIPMIGIKFRTKFVVRILL